MRFFHNHGFLGLDTQHQWLTLAGGSRTYVEALLKAHPADFRFGQGVTALRREGAQGGHFGAVAGDEQARGLAQQGAASRAAVSAVSLAAREARATAARV